VFLLVMAYPGCPGQKAVKRLCVCVIVLLETGKFALDGHFSCYLLSSVLDAKVTKTSKQTACHIHLT